MKIKLKDQIGVFAAGTEHEVIGFIPHGGHFDDAYQFVIGYQYHVPASKCEIIEDCSYHYFNPSGKWKYDGRGRFPFDGAAYGMTHETIAQANGGKMPGISSDGKFYTVVVIPDEHCAEKHAYPRMIKAVRHED